MVSIQPSLATACGPAVRPCVPGGAIASPENDRLHRRPLVATMKAGTLPARSSGSAAVSDLGTSLGSAALEGFDGRVGRLENNVTVLQRRLRDEGGIGQDGDAGMEAFVARLDDNMLAERRMREDLDARMHMIEDLIIAERKERDVQLRTFSSELEATMRGLVGRIDEGLSAGAATMRERTDQTETRLRALIERVDAGLSAGAAALQDSLASNGSPSPRGNSSQLPARPGEPFQDDWPHDRLAATAPLQPEAAPAQLPSRIQESSGWKPAPQSSLRLLAVSSGPKPSLHARGIKSAGVSPSATPGAPAVGPLSALQQRNHSGDQIMKSLEELRQENQRLRERRAQLHGTRASDGSARSPLLKAASPAGITPSATPSLAFPSTLQVPGSGLGSASSPGSAPLAGTRLQPRQQGTPSHGGAGTGIRSVG